eukprot:TRINITY_DN4235_c0_g1_i1.p1 TRINITY_DN4235_c0_g1~~TRINITY_DN4235_c0_g1_i1.p1  ORF type:complete len:197 (+),score=35.97 TRINITY_DN4235_c0_g1_i1:23-592(+)
MVRVLVGVADGSEDIEFSTITDILVRGGVEVVVASVMPHKQVRLARGLQLVADSLIGEQNPKDFDAVALPGGMPGAENFHKSEALNAFVVQMKEAGKIYAAICATPCVMFAQNPSIVSGVNHITCYPAMQDKLRERVPGAEISQERVVVDGKCVTSQGPATTMPFALKLVELLVSPEKAGEISKALLYT